MSRYYLISILLSTCIGGIGLILLLSTVFHYFYQTNSWLHKKFSVKRSSQSLLARIEPRFQKEDLQSLEPINDTTQLLFEEHTFDPRIFSIFYLMSPPSQEYKGYVLWQALLSQKLKYGPMDIFHAFDSDHAQGRILFSIANALEPGYFNIDHIDKIKTPGLCLFMRHQPLSYPLQAFESMLKVGKRLEHLLGGTLCDKERKPLAEATIQHYRHQLSSIIQPQ